MAETSMAVWEALLKGVELADGDQDFPRRALSRFVHDLMAADVAAQISAQRYERTDERTTQRNGVRQRAWDTRVGTLDPRMRW